MTKMPAFVTFTGLDEMTDLERVAEISQRWHVEWGILFSEAKQGRDRRYPSEHWIRNSVPILMDDGVRLAAHVCGAHSRKIMEDCEMIPLDFTGFRRIQVNHGKPTATGYETFARNLSLRRPNAPSVIVQCRGEFPADYRQRLYDPSGGRGERQTEWPAHPGKDMLVGYAGGIDPDCCVEVVQKISDATEKWQGHYWIDMDSGVRTDNWLDLDKCETVLQRVGNSRG